MGRGKGGGGGGSSSREDAWGKRVHGLYESESVVSEPVLPQDQSGRGGSVKAGGRGRVGGGEAGKWDVFSLPSPAGTRGVTSNASASSTAAADPRNPVPAVELFPVPRPGAGVQGQVDEAERRRQIYARIQAP